MARSCCSSSSGPAHDRPDQDGAPGEREYRSGQRTVTLARPAPLPPPQAAAGFAPCRGGRRPGTPPGWPGSARTGRGRRPGRPGPAGPRGEVVEVLGGGSGPRLASKMAKARSNRGGPGKGTAGQRRAGLVSKRLSTPASAYHPRTDVSAIARKRLLPIVPLSNRQQRTGHPGATSSGLSVWSPYEPVRGRAH